MDINHILELDIPQIQQQPIQQPQIETLKIENKTCKCVQWNDSATKALLTFLENNKEGLEKLKTTCCAGSKPNVPFWLNASAYLTTLGHFFNDVQCLTKWKNL